MILSPEERLLFTLSSPTPSKTAIEEATRELSSGKSFDFPKLLSLARRNGVLPFLYRNLVPSEVVPQEVVSSLKHCYLMTAGSNMVNSEETIRIIELLGSGGFGAIPLKGSIASEIVFGDPGLYLASDIDILVKPSDLERAKELLAKEGYVYNETEERDLLSSHYHLILHRQGHHIELHWNLVKRYFNVPPGFWWEDTQLAQHNGKSLRMLSPERYLLYAIFRLFDHGFGPLKFLVLIAGLIGRYREEIDWPKLHAYVRRFKMERLVFFVFRLSHEILGTELPHDFLGRRILGYGFLRDTIIAGILSESSRVHVKMLLYLLLLESPPEMLRIVFGRLFPRCSEIRLRYGLQAGSKTVYFYYLLNPILLATRKQSRQKKVNRERG